MKNRKHGFTLIELLIVIAIIGILAVAFLPSVLKAPAKARDGQRITNLRAISQALTDAHVEKADFPAAAGCVNATFDSGKVNLRFEDGIPIDPKGTATITYQGGASSITCPGNYYYVADTTNKKYGVVAQMETTQQANTTCAAALGATPFTLGTPADADRCYIFSILK